MALFIRPQIPTFISSSHADLKSCTPNLSTTPSQNRNPENIQLSCFISSIRASASSSVHSASCSYRKSVYLSVHLPICPLHSGIVSEWINGEATVPAFADEPIYPSTCVAFPLFSRLSDSSHALRRFFHLSSLLHYSSSFLF